MASDRKEPSREMGFTIICRVDAPVEVDYYHNGGILHKVLRDLGRS